MIQRLFCFKKVLCFSVHPASPRPAAEMVVPPSPAPAATPKSREQLLREWQEAKRVATDTKENVGVTEPAGKGPSQAHTPLTARDSNARDSNSNAAMTRVATAGSGEGLTRLRARVDVLKRQSVANESLRRESIALATGGGRGLLSVADVAAIDAESAEGMAQEFIADGRTVRTVADEHIFNPSFQKDLKTALLSKVKASRKEPEKQKEELVTMVHLLRSVCRGYGTRVDKVVKELMEVEARMAAAFVARKDGIEKELRRVWEEKMEEVNQRLERVQEAEASLASKEENLENERLNVAQEERGRAVESAQQRIERDQKELKDLKRQLEERERELRSAAEAIDSEESDLRQGMMRVAAEAEAERERANTLQEELDHLRDTAEEAAAIADCALKAARAEMADALAAAEARLSESLTTQAMALSGKAEEELAKTVEKMRAEAAREQFAALAELRASLEHSFTATAAAAAKAADCAQEEALGALRAQLSATHEAAMMEQSMDMRSSHEAAMKSLRDELQVAAAQQRTLDLESAAAEHAAALAHAAAEQEKMRKEMLERAEYELHEALTAAKASSDVAAEQLESRLQLEHEADKEVAIATHRKDFDTELHAALQEAAAKAMADKTAAVEASALIAAEALREAKAELAADMTETMGDALAALEEELIASKNAALVEGVAEAEKKLALSLAALRTDMKQSAERELSKAKALLVAEADRKQRDALNALTLEMRAAADLAKGIALADAAESATAELRAAREAADVLLSSSLAAADSARMEALAQQAKELSVIHAAALAAAAEKADLDKVTALEAAADAAAAKLQSSLIAAREEKCQALRMLAEECDKEKSVALAEAQVETERRLAFLTDVHKSDLAKALVGAAKNREDALAVLRMQKDNEHAEAMDAAAKELERARTKAAEELEEATCHAASDMTNKLAAAAQANLDALEAARVEMAKALDEQRRSLQADHAKALADAEVDAAREKAEAIAELKQHLVAANSESAAALASAAEVTREAALQEQKASLENAHATEMERALNSAAERAASRLAEVREEHADTVASLEEMLGVHRVEASAAAEKAANVRDGLERTIDELKAHIVSLCASRDEIAAKASKLKNSLDASTRQLGQEAAACAAEKAAAVKTAEEAAAIKAELEEQVAALSASGASAQKVAQEQMAALEANLKAARAETEAAVSAASSAAAAAAAVVEDLRAEVTAARDAGKVLKAELEGKVAMLDRAVQDGRAKLAEAEAAREAAVEEASKSNANLVARNGALATQLDEAEGRVEGIIATLNSEKDESERLRQECATHLGVIRARDSDLAAKEKEMNRIRSECAAEVAAMKESLGKTDEERNELLQKAAREKDALRREIERLEVIVNRIDEVEDQLLEAEAERRKLHNAIQELRGNVRVFARVRPLAASEGESCVEANHDGLGLALTAPSAKRGAQEDQQYHFSFDRVFDSRAQQEDVFEEVSGLVQSALDGYKVCLFAYGQTGSGKTHTMLGAAGEKRGIIPRTVEKVLSEAQRKSQKGWHFDMEASYVEIYNERIRDLLDAGSMHSDSHHVSHNPAGGCPEVTGVIREAVPTADAAAALVRRAAAARSVESTRMNATSSRSHTLFMLYITGEHEAAGTLLAGCLVLVDLAGSERVARSGAEGARLKEACAINKSLSSLGDVFTAISNGQKHIPFRNSKLTHLLQPCLSGDGKTLMFVNLNPHTASAEETLCSMRFASHVNTVELAKNGGRAKRNVVSVSNDQVAGEPTPARPFPGRGGIRSAGGPARPTTAPPRAGRSSNTSPAKRSAKGLPAPTPRVQKRGRV